MIKKSRKILTLLLACLLIMSSLSALSVSADATTSYEILDGETVINNDNLLKSYDFTHELATGYYMLTVESKGDASNPVNNTDGFYGVKATIGSAAYTGDAKSARSANTVKTGSFYLEEGKSYTVDLKYALKNTAIINTINKLTFEKQSEIALSTTSVTRIPATDYLNRDFRRYTDDGEDPTWKSSTSKGDEKGWVGKATFDADDYATYMVTVPESTVYQIYYIVSASSGKPGFRLYVDDRHLTRSVKGVDNDFYPLKNAADGYYYMYERALGRKVYLSAGTHMIKIQAASGSGYLGGLRFEPTANTVSNSQSSEFRFYGDAMLGESISTFPNDTDSKGTADVTTGVNGFKQSNGQAKVIGGTTYATYPIYAEDDGMYDITFIGGTRNAKVDIYIDGEASPFKGSYDNAGTSWNTPMSDFVGSVYLTRGYHTIKFDFTETKNGNVLMYSWTIAPTTNVTELNASETTTIAASSTTGYKHTDTDSEIESNRVMVKPSKTYYYEVNSPEAMEYTLITKTSGPNDGANITITDVDTGIDLYTGTIGNRTADYNTTTETELGKISLKAGRTTIKVQPSGNARYLYAFKLTPVIENKIIADINTEIAQGEGYETVTVPVKFEGKIDNLAALEAYVGYDEGVTYTGYTAGNVVTGMMDPIAEDNSIPLIWADLPAEGVEVTSGTLATLQFSVPKTIAKDYEFTVTVQRAAGTDQIDFADTIKTEKGKVTVKSIFTFTDGSTTVDDVVAGTMKLTVDLSGNNNKDLVIFAIYKDNGEYAILEDSAIATIENGVATATINNITLDGSKNYYAKAFVWDDESYYGFVQTLGK